MYPGDAADLRHDKSLTALYVCGGMCVHACVRACVRACVCVLCVCAGTRGLKAPQTPGTTIVLPVDILKRQLPVKVPI